MKKVRLLTILMFLVILSGYMVCFSVQDSNGDDFAAFRKKKLKLIIREAVNLVVLDAAVFDGNVYNSSDMTVLPLIFNSLTKNDSITETEGYDSLKDTDGKKYVVFPQRSLQQCRQVKSLVYDLDGDGVEEKYFLRDGCVKVKTDKRLVWKTQEEWWVDDFFLSDANNDGSSDLSLLVWKSGSFGPQKPFWIKSEDNSIKNHLFVFKLKNGVFKPVWQSSNLDRPILAADIADIDGDGRNELIAIEGSYTDLAVRKATAWRWKGWGFYLVSG